MKRAYKIILWIVGITVLLVAAVAIAISPVAKSYVNKHGEELVGRLMSVEKLRVNIFTGNVYVAGFSLKERNGEDDFVSLGELRVRLRLMPLLSNKFIIKRISLSEPDVQILQRDSEFNFDDMIEFFSSGDDSAAEVETPKDKKPWKIGIYDISLVGGTLSYRDLAIDAQWDIRDVDVSIPGVYFEGGKTDVGLLLNFSEGGSLETRLAYDIENSEYDLHLLLSRLQMRSLLPYLQQSLDISSFDGRLSADLNVVGNTNHLMEFAANGRAGVAGVSVADAAGAPLASLDSLYVAVDSISLAADKYLIDSVYIDGVAVHYTINRDGSTNVASLFKPSQPSAEAGSEPAAESGYMDLTVGSFELRNSRIAFHDGSALRPFDYDISRITARCRNFSLEGRNRVMINATMHNTGSVAVRWDGDMSSLDNHDIVASFANIKLADFTPYCEAFTAYPLTGGNFSFRSQNIITNRYLRGTNHVDIYNCKVGNKRKDLKPEMNLPLKLGVYVLTDPKGHINIDLPVSGSLDSPEFSYRKIILKTIGNLLLKVVTAPFSFLMGGDNLSSIPFDVMQMGFTSEQYAQFDRVAQMLKDRPDVKVTLRQQYDYDKALAALSSNYLRMAYYNSMQEEPDARITMIEAEEIQSMKLNTPEITAFADSLCTVNNISVERRNNAQKAVALFAPQAAEQLARMTAFRNKALADYMTSKQAVPEGAFATDTIGVEKLKSYRGKGRFTITMDVAGETVEIEPEQDEETAAAAETTETLSEPDLTEPADTAAEEAEEQDTATPDATAAAVEETPAAEEGTTAETETRADIDRMAEEA